MDQPVDRKRTRIAVAFVLLAGAAGALTQVSMFKKYALVLFLVSAILVVAALVTALTRGPGRRWTIVAAALTAAVVGFAATQAGAAVQESQSVTLPGFSSSSAQANAAIVPTGQAGPGVVSSHVSASQTESIVNKAEEQHAAMTELSGSEGRSLIDGARTSGYSVQSGLSPDFQTAKAYRHNSGARVVVVQLRGTNAPEMSRVTYLYSQGKLGVVEMASKLIDNDHVSFRTWNDAQLNKDVVITRAGAPALKSNVAASGTSVQNVGVDWNRLNACLANAGVSWFLFAAISTACAAVCPSIVLCAPCIGAMAGWLGGMAAACVQFAWV